jgi:hypothetical protein
MAAQGGKGTTPPLGDATPTKKKSGARSTPPVEDPVLASREKLSESLTKGLPILAAVLATVAAYKGGLSRLAVLGVST